MVNWQVTATTIYCDAVDDYVTILVYKDWTTKCSGYQQYVENPTKETRKAIKERSRTLGRKLRCEGPLDYRVTDYRDKLKAEEETKTKAG